MPFGITVSYYDTQGQPQYVEGAMDQISTLVGHLPPSSAILFTMYAHGAPGFIDDYDAGSLAAMLRPKMRFGGQVHLYGCSTGGVEARWYSPIDGLGLLARAAMYAPFDEPEAGVSWTNNLARDLSLKLPGIYVLGLSGISFPLSRLNPWEGYRPRGLMADKRVYRDGKLTSAPPVP